MQFRSEGVSLDTAEMAAMAAPFAAKFAWMGERGYVPHLYQILFHAMSMDERLLRFRHLVAGRRGGKTLSAAWECIYYALHPEEFHYHVHARRSDKPLWIWCLTKDFPTGRAALLTVRQVLRDAGLTMGVEYKENRGNRYIEFANGTLFEFKTAEDPESLRGAGLDILWMDEAAFIPNDEAWNVVRPALADKQGSLITTTTPKGRNWLYDTFWSPDALDDVRQGRVEYTSIDNPYFPRSEWEAERVSMHPMLFKQEYQASFDALMGQDLHADWLHYYTDEDIEGRRLEKIVAVDPAISLSDRADHFVMACIAIDRQRGEAFLYDLYCDRIPFPDQLERIKDWFLEHRPTAIAIEAVAYQAALAQQALRLEGLPPVVPIFTKGKKWERILAMAPLFRYKRIRIRKSHRDFINQWIDYKSQDKNPKDDALDAVEIALRMAGVVLPEIMELQEPDWKRNGSIGTVTTMSDLVQREINQLKAYRPGEIAIDDQLGAIW